MHMRHRYPKGRRALRESHRTERIRNSRRAEQQQANAFFCILAIESTRLRISSLESRISLFAAKALGFLGADDGRLTLQRIRLTCLDCDDPDISPLSSHSRALLWGTTAGKKALVFALPPPSGFSLPDPLLRHSKLATLCTRTGCERDFVASVA
jgi:hypothetical protein